MNFYSTPKMPPTMTEAFEHPAGSVAAKSAGGATHWLGKLLHIHIAPSASYEMEELQEAQCIAGRGIMGDRYYNGTGTYSPKPDVREVTLFVFKRLKSGLFSDKTLLCPKKSSKDLGRSISASGICLF